MSREALRVFARVRGLDPTERAVLHEIAAAEQRNDVGRAWKVEDLAERVGRRRRVIAAVLRDLEALGMIRRWARPGCIARYAVQLEAPPVVFAEGARGKRRHGSPEPSDQGEFLLAVEPREEPSEQHAAPLQRPLQGSPEPLQWIAVPPAMDCSTPCNGLQPCPPSKFSKFSKCADARAGPEDRDEPGGLRTLPEAEAFLRRHGRRRR